MVLELGEIEDEATVAGAMLKRRPAEPAALLAAREESRAADKDLNDKLAAVAAIEATLLRLRSRPTWWQRTVGYFTGAEYRRNKEANATELKKITAERALAEAQARQSVATINSVHQQTLHRDVVGAYVAKWSEIAKQAETRLAAVAKARELQGHLPGAAFMGATGLYRLGEKLSTKRRRRSKAREGEAELSVHFR